MAKSKKKKSASAGADSIICSNRRATFDYTIEDRFEAGLVLMGSEVKSLRAGKASISEAYARLDNQGELWLEGAHIAEYPWANRQNHETNRRRKMLMNRREIHKISVRVTERGYTLVPMKLYFRKGYAKLEVGLGRGKKQHDKRASIKEKDVKREIQRQMA